MVRPYSDAQLAGLRGDGLIAGAGARFVFRGSERDAKPLSEALRRRAPIPYRGPVLGQDGLVECEALDVRILVIERLDTLTTYHFVCTLAPCRTE